MDHKDLNIVEECVDIINDLFKRFGAIIIHHPNLVEKESIMKLLTEHLTSENVSLRKKATSTIGSFSIILTGTQLKSLVTLLVDKITK
jgi:cullin-associated NEDD8-dissociated protein 1